MVGFVISFCYCCGRGCVSFSFEYRGDVFGRGCVSISFEYRGDVFRFHLFWSARFWVWGPFFLFLKQFPGLRVHHGLPHLDRGQQFVPFLAGLPVFSRPNLKHVVLLTATDFDTFDHALTQTEEKEQVIVSVLTSLLLEEVNQLEVESSSLSICEEAVSRLIGLCPQNPSCQARFFNW